MRANILVTAAALLFAAGCTSTPRAKGPAANAGEDAKLAAVELREATTQIQNANAHIEATGVPETATHTAAIGEGVTRLRGVEASLARARETIDATAQRQAALEKQLEKSNARVSELESGTFTLINRLLVGVFVLGLAGAVFAGVWLRSWQGIVLGVSVAVGAVVGQWLIAYRAIIALSLLGVGAVIVAYHIWRERKTVKQLVATGEAIKEITTENPYKLIRSKQDRVTEQVVRSIQKQLGKVKKPSPAPTIPEAMQ